MEYFLFQVLCNTGNLTVIPMDFPNGTQEIVITNQNIKEIPQKGEGKRVENEYGCTLVTE